MARRAHAGALAALAALLVAGAVPAGAGGAKQGVKGRVLDRTCYGFCAPETLVPQPYAGKARVVVRELGSRRRVGEARVRESRFRERLSPGRYRVKLKIADPCWERDRERVSVSRGEFERLRFVVRNRCIR